MNSHNTAICFKKKKLKKVREEWLFHMNSGNMQPMVTLLGQSCSNNEDTMEMPGRRNQAEFEAKLMVPGECETGFAE